MCGPLQHVLTGIMASIEDARAIGRMLSCNTTLLALDFQKGKFPSKPDMCNYVGWSVFAKSSSSSTLLLQLSWAQASQILEIHIMMMTH